MIKLLKKKQSKFEDLIDFIQGFMNWKYPVWQVEE